MRRLAPDVSFGGPGLAALNDAPVSPFDRCTMTQALNVVVSAQARLHPGQRVWSHAWAHGAATLCALDSRSPRR